MRNDFAAANLPRAANCARLRSRASFFSVTGASMQQALQIAQPNASNDIAEFRTQLRPVAVDAEIRKWFPELSKKLSREKAPATIHYVIGGDQVAKLRTVYDWCAGKFDPPAFVLMKLLHSAAGWHVLEYLMRGCKEPWWRQVVRARECAAAFDEKSRQMDLGL